MAKKRRQEKTQPKGAAERRGSSAPFVWHGIFLYLVAFVPLGFLTAALDLYDLPKRFFLNLLVLTFLGVHALHSSWKVGGVRWPQSVITLPAAAYGFVLFLSCFKAFNDNDALDGLLQQGLPAILMLLLLVRGLTDRMAERFISAAICAGTIATGLGLYQYAGYSTDWLGIRQVIAPASVFGNKNMAAEYIAMVLPLILYRIEQWSYRGPHLILAAGVLAFLFISKTKAVWITALVVLGMVGWRIIRTPALRGRLRGALPWGIGLVLVWGLFVQLPSLLHDSQAGAVSTLAAAAKATQDSYAVRRALWANSLPMLKSNPILGVGPRNWYIHYPLYSSALFADPTFNTRSQAEHPHNDLVQITAESGILGALAALWVVFTLLRLAWPEWAGTSRAVPATSSRNFHVSLSILAALVDGVFAYPLHLAPGVAYFWILGAILVTGSPEGQITHRTLPGGKFVGVSIAILCLLLGYREVTIIRSNAAYRRGAVHMANKKFDLAVGEVAEAIRFNPYQYRTHSVRGRALFMLRKPEEAIDEYRQALECHPNQINVIYNLAHALASSGRYDEAIKVIRRSIQIVPRFVEGWYLLGSYLKRTNDHDGALEAFRRLTEIDPSFADGHNEIGNILKARKQYDEAKTAYRKALEIKSDYGEIHNNLGVILLEQQKYAEAITEFELAAKKKPGYAGTFFNMARALEGVGRHADAIAAYERFLETWKGDEKTLTTARSQIERLRRKLPPLGQSQ